MDLYNQQQYRHNFVYRFRARQREYAYLEGDYLHRYHGYQYLLFDYRFSNERTLCAQSESRMRLQRQDVYVHHASDHQHRRDIERRHRLGANESGYGSYRGGY